MGEPGSVELCQSHKPCKKAITGAYSHAPTLQHLQQNLLFIQFKTLFPIKGLELFKGETRDSLMAHKLLKSILHFRN